MFYRSLNKHPAPDLPAHLSRIRASLRRPGGTDTLRAMVRGEGKDAASLRAATTVPTLVVMGDRDPDFSDPAAEAAAFAAECGANVRMAPGAGHYPHTETPEVVIQAIIGVAAQAGVRA